MAYKVIPSGTTRDCIYTSQIAAERPMCAPRIHCYEQPEVEESLRGGEQPMHGESACEKFNRQLREGHAGRNAGDE